MTIGRMVVRAAMNHRQWIKMITHRPTKLLLLRVFDGKDVRHYSSRLTLLMMTMDNVMMMVDLLNSTKRKNFKAAFYKSGNYPSKKTAIYAIPTARIYWLFEFTG